jgi:hypothetical protein
MRVVIRLMLAVLALAAACALGCGGSGGEKDATAADAVREAKDQAADVPADVPPDLPPDVPADVPPDAPPDLIPDAGPDSVSDTSADLGPDFGFDIRVPQMHSLKCESAGGPPGGEDSLDLLDTDWICTFEYAGMSGHIYMQNTPTKCVVLWDALPEFESQGWISLDGKVSELAKEYYDWGGNHQNDYLEFEFKGKHYKYYHSSCGFGWRKCFPMDCMVVSNLTLEVIEDGCAADRKLPIVCMPIKEDGTYDPLVDKFEKCLGDQGPC